MDKVIIEGIRCLQQRQEIKLAPITVLVGENSTGKTTFLAAINIASKLATGDLEPDFNEPPFQLGAYEQIASYVGGRAGRAKSFVVGYEITSPHQRLSRTRRVENLQSIRVEATFCQRRAQPQLSDWRVETRDYKIAISFTDGDGKNIVTIETPKGTVRQEVPIRVRAAHAIDYLFYVIERELDEKKPRKGLTSPHMHPRARNSILSERFGLKQLCPNLGQSLSRQYERSQ